MRSLTTIRKINDIQPIPGADNIEVATVDGWEVVVKKGDFAIGDYAVYFEIDSFIPNSLAPFLTKPGKTPKMFKGVAGERLRTIRLRKQLSQGLLLSLSTLHAIDLSTALGIEKYEKPLPACLRGTIKGNFPTFIPKTDQERIQNIPEILEQRTIEYEVSLKLDGSSITIFHYEDDHGVCSRNLQLKLDESNSDNTFVSATRSLCLLEVVDKIYADKGRSVALQGELVGPGIQKNRNGLNKYHVYVFDIWDIDEQRYLSVEERHTMCNRYGIQMVPIIKKRVSLMDLNISTMVDALKYPQNIKIGSFYTPIEGVVFKRDDGAASFKIINNKYLENDKD